MRHLREFMFLGAGLVLAVLAGVMGFVALAKATAQGNGLQATSARVTVVVAARAISARSVLGADDLQVKDVSPEAIPEGAIRKVEEAAGKLALIDLYAGEVILTQRLLDPNVITGNGRMALFLSEDKVLMAFPARDLMSRIDVLKPGDQVDLLFSFDFPTSGDLEGQARTSADGANADKALSTFSLLQNVTISAIVGGNRPTETVDAEAKTREEVRPPDALLLTLSPQDALILKYMKDAGGVADIVLRSPGVDRPFSADRVDVDYIMNRYRIVKDGTR